MSVDQLVAVPLAFDTATDPGFKARSISEYDRVKAWTKRIDLDKARILDFGCGLGIAAASFALRHPGVSVTGLDIEPIDEAQLKQTYRRQLGCDLPRNLNFQTVAPGQFVDSSRFDLIYAWSVFEHVRDELMVDLFHNLKERLSPGGLLFIQVDPLYFSPRGSHLYNYFKSPWHHLVLSLDALREGVLADKPSLKEQREWTQFLELNRLTAQDIVGRAVAAGLKLVKMQTFTTDIDPPPRLARVYDRDVLTTREVMAVFE